jgi:hypothetical protein
MAKLHRYLLEIRDEVLPKSPEGVESVGHVVFWKTAIWRSTTAPRSEPTATSLSAAAIGRFSVATMAVTVAAVLLSFI